MTGEPTKPPPLRGIARYSRVVEDNELIRAYLAGVIDSGSSIRVHVKKDDSYAVGFALSPIIEVRRSRRAIPELLAMWGDSIGVRSDLKENEKNTRWIVNRRDDIQLVLELLAPYMMVYDSAAEVMIEEVLPRLERGEHTTKDGFIEVMEYVDFLREATGRERQSKYSQDYFRELWAEA